jgi:hypothetical protein
VRRNKRKRQGRKRKKQKGKAIETELRKKGRKSEARRTSQWQEQVRSSLQILAG